MWAKILAECLRGTRSELAALAVEGGALALVGLRDAGLAAPAATLFTHSRGLRCEQGTLMDFCISNMPIQWVGQASCLPIPGLQAGRLHHIGADAHITYAEVNNFSAGDASAE